MIEVTDPELLAQLNNASKEVTDPSILAQLNGSPEASIPNRPDSDFASTMKKRGARYANIFQGANGYGQSLPEQVGQTAMNALGTGGDAIGSALSYMAAPALKAGFNALPQGGQDALRNLGGSIAPYAQAYQQNQNAYNAANPRAGANFEAMRELINLVPLGSSPVRKVAGEASDIGMKALGNAGKEIINPIIPNVDDAVKPLAQRAREFDIPLRADQVLPTRFRNTVQKISQELPFSGVDDFEKTQKNAWNAALAKTIGQDTENLGPDVIKSFRKDSNKKFDEVLLGKEISINPEDISGLSAIKDSARKSIETGLADVVDKNVDDVIKDFASGKLSGEKLASIRSEMLKTSTRAQGGANEFIGDVVNAIDDIAARHITPEEAGKLAEARKQWRNFRTIGPLLEKSTDGKVNPTDLLNRVASSRFINASGKSVSDDDLVDLARIGKQFLPKKGGSDTFQKAAIGAGLFGTGGLGALAVTNPAAAGIAAAAGLSGLAANRAGQGINQSQFLIDLALKGAKEKK